MSNIKEEMQLAGFQIIANVGTAKSMYLEAMEFARNKDYDKARALIEEGREVFGEAHKHHFELIAKESQGEDLPFSLILMHAEDQMLNTETIQILVSEMVTMYEMFNK